MITYEPVIGLEVHIQLSSSTKIFCACSANVEDADPNTTICPVCSGLPGVLPVLNKDVVEMAMAMAMALDCQINPTSTFHRKNYFYPDLPKGYQITQHDEPLAEYGRLQVMVDGTIREVGIRKLHMEEDAGKNVHEGAWLVDFNRCGVPLIEIVSQPEITSPEMAEAYLRHMQQLARYLGVSDADMQKGNLRCDANVSIRPVGSDEMRQKTEVKNINSFRFVKRAIELEMKRQERIYNEGGEIRQVTLGYDENKDRVYVQREKESEEEYRYFHEPDLPAVMVSDEWQQAVRGSLPELPVQRYGRFVRDYELQAETAAILTLERVVADYFEETVTAYAGEAAEAAKWINNDVLKMVSDYRDIDRVAQTLTPAHLAELMSLVDAGTINRNTAKDLLGAITPEKSPGQLVKERGLEQVSDSGELEAICQRVLEANDDAVQQILSGKDGALNFLLGQVMKETRGKADPGVVRPMLQKMVEKMR